jgi:predicted outer membrane repeat protein
LFRPVLASIFLLLVGPMPASATLHVPGEYATIQAAIDAADHGDSVLVAPGVYSEECQETPYGPSMLVMKSGVTLLSEAGPEATILDARQECRVILCRYVDDAGIEGFTITGGIAAGQELYEDHGGGLFLFHSSLLVADCIFLENVSRMGGGFACDHPSIPLLLRCSFVENSAAGGRGGGAAFLGSSAIFVTDCTFFGNEADLGGGMESSVSTPSLNRCAFIQNSATSLGGAIHCHIASMDLTDCTLALNTAPEGASIYCALSSFVTITHCTLFGNSAAGDAGGVVACQGGSTALLGNTILAFSAQGRPVSCVDGSSGAILQCCDLYGNEGGDWVGCIADQQGEDGNISEDPIFCDADGGDFTVDESSPCAAENNPTCGRIGAWPVGCESPTSVESATWGRIKAARR